MPPSTITLTTRMTLRLKQIIYEYLEVCDLSESTSENLHYVLASMTVLQRPSSTHFNINHPCFTQRKFDILLALEYHFDNIRTFPKQTYKILTGAIQCMNIGFNSD